MLYNIVPALIAVLMLMAAPAAVLLALCCWRCVVDVVAIICAPMIDDE